jgi:putative transposase
VAANQTRAVVLIHESLINRCGFRVFPVLDRRSSESVAIEVILPLTGERVTRLLEQLHNKHGLPLVIQGDNGSVLCVRELDQRDDKHGVRLQFIKPGKRIQNPHIEIFSERLREGCLDEHLFFSRNDARVKIEQRCIHYNRECPDLSLGNLTPEEFAAQAADCEGAHAHRSISALRTIRAKCASASDPRRHSFQVILGVTGDQRLTSTNLRMG